MFTRVAKWNLDKRSGRHVLVGVSHSNVWIKRRWAVFILAVVRALQMYSESAIAIIMTPPAVNHTLCYLGHY